MHLRIGFDARTDTRVHLDFNPLGRKIGELIEGASDVLDHDQTVARSRLDEALELLRSSGWRKPDTVPRPVQVTRGGLAPWHIRRIQACTETCSGEQLKVADLAAMCRLSVSYFSAAFRRSFGYPPGQMLTRARVRQAQALMGTTILPLSQIALDCGFCDQSHFSRQFLRATGVTPLRWRREHAELPVSKGSEFPARAKGQTREQFAA
jgi:AraC family transcriptional regulator